MGRLSMALAAAVAVLAMTATAVTAASGEGDLADELQDTREQLDRTRERLDRTEEQVGDARSQLARADRELVALTEELHRREEELRRARTELERSREEVDAATRQLRAVTRRLDRVRSRLEERRRLLRDRAADAYKHGGSLSYTEAILGADDLSDLSRQLYFLSAVMEADQQVVDEAAADARTVSILQAEADAVRDRRAAEAARLARTESRIEEATEQQRRLTEVVARERRERAQLVDRLQSDRQTYEAMVADLEAESERLAEELAASRWRAGAPGTGSFVWPTDGVRTSGYGWRTHPIFGTRRMHHGIDISGTIGQGIVAAASGRVHSAGWRGGYGQATVIDHGGGVFTLYAHQSRLVATAGEVVEAGQKIGEVGSTGASTGPHLHFEVRVDGASRDPMEWY